MAKYIDKIDKYKIEKLLDEMKIKPDEKPFYSSQVSTYEGKLHVSHGTTISGEYIESIYNDFVIELLYGSQPSEYDQEKYQNIMKVLCKSLGNYTADCEIFNASNRPNRKTYFDGYFKDEEYYEEDEEEEL